MSKRPTPETDALREAIDNGVAVEAEMTSWAMKFERERDEAREQLSAAKHFLEKYIAKRDELLDILRKLLEIIPEPECHGFGHTKEERHAFLEECPVMARYDALIAQAKEALK